MEIFDWKRILIDDLPLSFLLEVMLRTAAMFACLLVALRFTGKRGVKQLSIFEIVIIIALGSAAGDPMFYEDVGILPAIVVFVVVISFYRTVTWLTGKSKPFERLLEGSTHLLVEHGVFSMIKFEKEDIAQDEFFSELRLKSIEHLGQIKYAFLEHSGNISVYYYSEAEVRPGLPLMPHLYDKRSKIIAHAGTWSCANCGFTEHKEPGKAVCSVCETDEWVESIRTIRQR